MDTRYRARQRIGTNKKTDKKKNTKRSTDDGMPGPKKPKIDPATDTCVQKPLMLLNSKVMSCKSIEVMLNRKGLGVRKIAQTLSEHEMATILAWHGEQYPPAIAIREMPGAMKRLATKSLVGLAQADYDYKIPKLMMDQEGRRDQIMQDWLIAGGEGTSSSHKSGVDSFKKDVDVKQDCSHPVLLNPHILSDSSMKLLLEYDDMTIDNIATTFSDMELDGVIGYNEGCMPGGTHDEKAIKLNEMVTLRGAAAAKLCPESEMESFMKMQQLLQAGPPSIKSPKAMDKVGNDDSDDGAPATVQSYAGRSLQDLLLDIGFVKLFIKNRSSNNYSEEDFTPGAEREGYKSILTCLCIDPSEQNCEILARKWKYLKGHALWMNREQTKLEHPNITWTYSQDMENALSRADDKKSKP